MTPQEHLSILESQYAWLERELQDTRDAVKLVIVLSERPVVTRVWSDISEAEVDACVESIRELQANAAIVAWERRERDAT